MSRHIGLNRVYASVSVIAVLGVLAGCSQPASYATVDLGGSYGNAVPQAYSAQSGLPVYQSTQVYTTPYSDGVASPSPQSQLVYQDAPLNQVASLAPIYGGGYSDPVQQSYPSFGSVGPGQILTDETILRSDGFIDIGNYDGQQTATLSPGAGSIGFDRMPVMNDVPQYLPTPQPVAPVYQAEPIYQNAPLPYSAPVTSELAPLAVPYADAPQVVEDTYASVANDFYDTSAPLAQAVPTYAPIDSTPLGLLQAEPETFAGLSPMPDRNDTQNVIDYYDLATPVQAPLVREVRLPVAVQTPAPAAPAATYAAPNGLGITLPPASQEYPRPYEALPPGFFPTYEFPSGNDLISQAAPAPVQLASVAPQQALFEDDLSMSNGIRATVPAPLVEQASSGRASAGSDYTIQPGDTLYGIARKHGVTPLEIAHANGMPLAGTIYPGTVLNIPEGVIAGRPETLGDAPIVVLQTAEAAMIDTPIADAASISTFTHDLTDQSVDMIDINELARMFRDRETGLPGAAMPIISAEAGSVMRGRPDLSPTERLSEPVGTVTAPAFVAAREIATPVPVSHGSGSYAWPIHGEVYRLPGGGIEIGAAPGKTVTAAATGRVVHVENGSRGVLVVIEHNDGWRSLTIGLRTATVQIGQRVFTGDPLGYSGGDRIGFELRDGSSNVAETLGILRS